jgi:predicted dehydrogenase
VQAGELGRTRYLQATRTNLGPIRSDVNVVYDLASHDVSIFNYLLGDPPTHVRAAGMSFLQHGVEDVAFVTLYYPNQVLAHLQASWLHPKKVRELTIVGDRKMATWNDLSTTGPIALFAKHVLTPGDFTDFGQFHLLVKDGDINIPYVPLREPLRVQAEAFLHAVRTRERPLADGRFAAQVAAALAAANRSMRSDGETTPVEI